MYLKTESFFDEMVNVLDKLSNIFTNLRENNKANEYD